MFGTTSEPLIESRSDFDRWWFKVENRVNSDLRYARLSCNDLGMYVRLLAVANMREPGRIRADIKDIAFTIRVTEAELLSSLEELKSAGLIAVDSDGITIAEKDAHYQGGGLNYSDSREGRRERQSRKRERDRAVQGEADGCHGDTSPAREDQTRPDEDQTGEYEEQYLALKEEGTSEGAFPEGGLDDVDTRPLRFDGDEILLIGE